MKSENNRIRRLLVIGAALLWPALSIAAGEKESPPEIKIIKDSLIEVDNFYGVKGVVYNPNLRAVKNVEINYFIWKKWLGADGHGSVIKSTGGRVTAMIKYLPPKTPVEFTAVNHNAPIMTVESGLLPDPLDAEISASWDKAMP